MMDAKITTKKIPEKRFFVKVNKRPPKNAAQMHCTGNRASRYRGISSVITVVHPPA